MKNKIELRKTIRYLIIVVIIFTIICGFFNYYQYKKYTYNFNLKLEGIINQLEKDYPDVDKTQIVKLLNNDNKEAKNNLRDYGIDIDKDSLILVNDKYFEQFLIQNICLVLIFSILIFVIFLNYNHKKDIKLQEITRYLEEINRKNYKLDIDDNSEDELSILKNEIYKTTVMLKEIAEN